MNCWSVYYDSLEQWWQEQCRQMNHIQKTFENASHYQNLLYQANGLASQKFTSEMQSAERSYSSETARSSIGTERAQFSDVRFRERDGPVVQSHRFIIPHPWRRIAAEFIDISLVMLLKLLLIGFLKNDSIFVNLSKYIGLNFLSGIPEYRTLRRAHGWVKSELKKEEFPISNLERLLFLTNAGDGELIDFDLIFVADQLGRFLRAIIEAVLISHSFIGSGPGGATIGKWLMNLRVVTCEEVFVLPDMVEVVPGTNLGIARALVRSMLKGTSFLTTFSFVCMLFFRHHRCTYDIIAGTLVVQALPHGATGRGNRPANPLLPAE